ncbi:NAD(P)/FAD-dependent oxidoreductase [Priestia flexa]|uniref:NADH dehydrogenase n=1 Tax=Priestia veravalensis TaxID=1414648 RepID=A0A0V8JK67_9BACI|nr:MULTISPECIES: NAD(P)/FAD-dependent oxidoreductase [Priestia]KSU87369.1 NADH dehydrogenase [Priestia veravalensis]MBY6086877.1 NAD(P)/FAD-dependent oxidoreductase [Priestia flexa]MCA1203686.1 NAD(P)/FAD-dependent oxidoreductase [Priestia flexa]MCG7314938.1 NAD(P)/FAD-dependent oxidoreductase [Priestia flexa]MCP1191058.1 NAD(P)/FAD-dependent oxidoreductase [Priestia flexa]
MKKPKIVVLGAGYGGIMTTVHLQKKLGTNDAEITLVNKNDYHYETTWLHEVSAGTLHHDRSRFPVKSLINTGKVNFVKDTVMDINTAEKRVILENSELEYDYLVVGLGYESETFGIKGLKEYAFSIANINAARQIREHIDYVFATYNNEPVKRDELLTIVVGGAGFTGIEFVGELANRVPQLCKEFDIPREKVRIICVEAAPTALPGFDPELVEYAVTQLERKGVEFKIGTAIKECTEEGILVEKDDQVEEIKSATVVWAAGVRGSHIIEKAGFENNRCRVKVSNSLLAPGHEDVFIVGDCSFMINPENDRPYPPTAQVAMQQGETCAENIARLIRGEKELKEFKADLKGTVCSLGHDDAIGVVYGRKLFGSSASFMKKVVDNRSLFLQGGVGLVLKKGKFNFF